MPTPQFRNYRRAHDLPCVVCGGNAVRCAANRHHIHDINEQYTCEGCASRIWYCQNCAQRNTLPAENCSECSRHRSYDPGEDIEDQDDPCEYEDALYEVECGNQVQTRA